MRNRLIFTAAAMFLLTAPSWSAPAGQVDNLPKPAIVNDLGLQVIQQRPQVATEEFAPSPGVARAQTQQLQQEASVATMNQDINRQTAAETPPK